MTHTLGFFFRRQWFCICRLFFFYKICAIPMLRLFFFIYWQRWFWTIHLKINDFVCGLCHPLYKTTRCIVFGAIRFIQSVFLFWFAPFVLYNACVSQCFAPSVFLQCACHNMFFVFRIIYHLFYYILCDPFKIHYICFTKAQPSVS